MDLLHFAVIKAQFKQVETELNLYYGSLAELTSQKCFDGFCVNLDG